MGPPLGRGGNIGSDAEFVLHVKLQWGRLLEEAEI